MIVPQDFWVDFWTRDFLLLCKLFQKVCALRPSHLLIVGDFNYNHIDWNTFTVNDVGPEDS